MLEVGPQTPGKCRIHHNKISWDSGNMLSIFCLGSLVSYSPGVNAIMNELILWHLYGRMHEITNNFMKSSN